MKLDIALAGYEKKKKRNEILGEKRIDLGKLWIMRARKRVFQNGMCWKCTILRTEIKL